MKIYIYVLIALFALTAGRADEYDTLRLKYRDSIIGVGYDTADPLVISKLASMASSANSYWSTMDKSPTRTYLWSTLASPTDSQHLSENYGRLRIMTIAYASPGCSLYRNATLLTDIIAALDWMNVNRYNTTTQIAYDNWWDSQIGSPISLNKICALLYDYLTPTQLTNYMAAIDHQTPSPNRTGANLVGTALVVGVRGCLVKDAAKIALARDSLSGVFPYVTTSDGFYTDGSFIQHIFHPYTGGYGLGLLNDLTDLLRWLSGSSWQVTDPAGANIFRWVFDSFEPIVFRGNTFDLVRGRSPGASGATPNAQVQLEAIMKISQFAPPADAARMKSMVKEWALSNTMANFVASCGLDVMTDAKQMVNDPSVVRRGDLIAHYTFPCMDRVIHLGLGYGFGLTMYSTRVANFESINGQNLHGWFTGDGQTTLYNADLDAFSDAYWATVDAYRLPGVTADVTAAKLPHVPDSLGLRAQGQSTLSAYPWVGGATLDNYGAAGMQFKGIGVTLTGKKSWFMFDDEIVCLGADITSTDGRPIETTVEQRKLNTTGDNVLVVNGVTKSQALGWTESMSAVTWANLAGSLAGADIGYYFPTAPTLKGVRQARTGAWSDVNETGSTTPITRNYLRLSFEHGSSPTGATYQYVLLPGRNATRTGQYAAAPQVTVLANDGNVQAVKETTLGITAANFWTDTTQSVGGITSNKKASVLVRNDGTFIDVAVSDPTQLNSGTITLQIALNGCSLVDADPGVTITQVSPTIAMTVNTAAAKGKTFKVSFFCGTTQSITLYPQADSYVFDSAATVNTNYGTAGSMAVKRYPSGGYNRESFLRFDVPSSSGVLLGASLQLMPLTSTTPSTPGLNGVQELPNNTWIESGTGGITWNNRPTMSTPLLSSWTPKVGVLVNANVLPAISGPGLHSFHLYALPTSTDDLVTYGTREHTTAANRPRLVLSIGHTPPEVAITSPADGDIFPGVGLVTLSADAEATDGAITSVAFYDGAALLGTATSAPYQLTSNFGGGTHLITAVATDANGLTKTSLVTRFDIPYPPTAASTSTSTAHDTSIDVDLRSLCSDQDTPVNSLRFTVGTAASGTVVLLADGHTARFTPTASYTGPAGFSYNVTDTTPDSRTLLNYGFQNGDVSDTSGQNFNGTLKILGTGTAAFTTSVPAALAPYTQSLSLTETGTLGAARVERNVGYDFLGANWTIAGWFRRATATNIDLFVQLGNTAGGGNSAMTLGFFSTATTLELKNYNGWTMDTDISKTGVATGSWNHFAIVRSGTTLSLYLNGALVGSDTAFTFSFSNTLPLAFGGVVTTNLDRWFNGSLADLAVFDSDLSAADVARLSTLPVAWFGGQSSTATVTINVF